MEESKKEGYLAGGIFLILGILAIVIGFDQGWTNGKITIIIGLILFLLGGGSIWKPETFGQVLAHYLAKQAEGHGDKISQSQQNSPYSTQTNARGNVTINNNYLTKNLPEERDSDEKRELKKEINRDLTTKEKVSNILMKCIRLAIITGLDKEKSWLEREAQGFWGDDGKVSKTDIPKYRKVDGYIIIADKNGNNQQKLDFPIGLAHPVFQIEGWVEDYEKGSGKGEMILRTQTPEVLKKIHKEVIGKEPVGSELPVIISVSQLKSVLNGLKIEISKFVNSVR